MKNVRYKTTLLKYLKWLDISGGYLGFHRENYSGKILSETTC